MLDMLMAFIWRHAVASIAICHKIEDANYWESNEYLYVYLHKFKNFCSQVFFRVSHFVLSSLFVSGTIIG